MPWGRGPSLHLRDTLNQVVERHPELLPALARFGLDTCCGGALPIETAAARHGIPAGVLREALEEGLREAARRA